MNIYVANGTGYGKQMIDLCKSLKLKDNITPQILLDYGFTNYNEPILYYMRKLGDKDYNVSFGISIKKKTMKIFNIDLLNEDILQPHHCNQYDYQQVKNIINKLIKDNILEKKVKRGKKTNS